MGTLLLSGGRRLDTNGSDLSKHFSFNRLGPPSPHSLLWELCSVYWICWIFSPPFDEQKALKERRGNSNHFQIWVLYGEPEWILEFRSDFECYQFTHSVEQKGFDPSSWEIILILIPSRAWLTCILWLQSFVRREMWKDRPSQSVAQDITRGHWSDDIGFHQWVRFCPMMLLSNHSSALTRVFLWKLSCLWNRLLANFAFFQNFGSGCIWCTASPITIRFQFFFQIPPAGSLFGW